MKKLFIFLALLVSLTACGFNDSANPNDNRYESFKQVILANQQFVAKPKFYDLNVEVNKVKDLYRYYIFIDNPKIAMYDIKAMALIEGENYDDEMAANVGIFEGENYNMIPNQFDSEKGYVKGLVLSGLTDKEPFNLKILIQYTNQERSNVYQDFIRLENIGLKQ